MSLCPVTWKPCMDDLCHGGGCLRSQHGASMIERCAACGVYYDPDFEDCECYDEYPDFEEEGDYAE